MWAEGMSIMPGEFETLDVNVTAGEWALLQDHRFRDQSMSNMTHPGNGTIDIEVSDIYTWELSLTFSSTGTLGLSTIWVGVCINGSAPDQNNRKAMHGTLVGNTAVSLSTYIAAGSTIDIAVASPVNETVHIYNAHLTLTGAHLCGFAIVGEPGTQGIQGPTGAQVSTHARAHDKLTNSVIGSLWDARPTGREWLLVLGSESESRL